MIPSWLQIAIVTGVVGLVVAFWAWVRARLTILTAEMAAIQGWRDEIENRCAERRQLIEGVGAKIDGLHDRITSLGDRIAGTDTQTARAIGCLEGKLDGLMSERGGKVHT